MYDGSPAGLHRRHRLQSSELEALIHSLCTGSTTDSRHSDVVGWLQAVQNAASADGRSLTLLTPAVLRRALRQAGRVVNPAHIDEVLMYVISEGEIADLDKLHLVLLRDGSVQQLHYNYGVLSSTQLDEGQQFFIPGNSNASKKMYSLMEDSKHMQVKKSPAWCKIAG